MRRAFTLIELLIVIGIISILALIALPNFLEAQVRAKVTRARADLRTHATAIELYRTDNNHYPPEQDDDGMPVGLTTPVQYLSSLPVDSFNLPSDDFNDKLYKYHNVKVHVDADEPDWPDTDLRRYGDWRMFSFGPRQEYMPYIPYDPTNGSVSEGNILRTQMSGDGNIPFTYWDPQNPTI